MLWQALDPKSRAFSRWDESSQEKRERARDLSETTGRRGAGGGEKLTQAPGCGGKADGSREGDSGLGGFP